MYLYREDGFDEKIKRIEYRNSFRVIVVENNITQQESNIKFNELEHVLFLEKEDNIEVSNFDQLNGIGFCYNNDKYYIRIDTSSINICSFNLGFKNKISLDNPKELILNILRMFGLNIIWREQIVKYAEINVCDKVFEFNIFGTDMWRDTAEVNKCSRYGFSDMINDKNMHHIVLEFKDNKMIRALIDGVKVECELFSDRAMENDMERFMTQEVENLRCLELWSNRDYNSDFDRVQRDSNTKIKETYGGK